MVFYHYHYHYHYQAKRPHGIRTYWLMDEYRLLGLPLTSPNTTQKPLIEMEDWVVCLCQTYHKKRRWEKNGAETEFSVAHSHDNKNGTSIMDIKMEDSNESGYFHASKGYI